jgi:molecular chaperone IbpA
MTKITSFDLTPFYRNTVGIDSLFDRITRNIDMAANAGNYPPYDIVKDGQLVIEGAGISAVEGVEYLHHGISSRSFIRSFSLSDYVEVREAVMKDGILTVRLERVVPEVMKPKKISIAYEN